MLLVCFKIRQWFKIQINPVDSLRLGRNPSSAEAAIPTGERRGLPCGSDVQQWAASPDTVTLVEVAEL